MLLLLAFVVAAHLLAARLAIGPITAVLIAIVAIAYLLALLTRAAWRPLVARLMVVGLAAGIIELFTDAAGERFAHSLIYPPGEVFIWDSPAYMPFSWMIVLTILGYLGWRLRGLLPGWAAVALAGLVGALNIPFYEEAAYYAGWWRYAAAPHLGHTPLYVLLFEGLIVAGLALLLGGDFARAPWRGVLLRGALLGAWMPCAALASWLLLGH